MTLHEIATPYNDETLRTITSWLRSERLEVSLNKFESYVDHVLFFVNNTLVLASTIEAKGRTIVAPETFIKTHYQYIEQETINAQRNMRKPYLKERSLPYRYSSAFDPLSEWDDVFTGDGLVEKTHIGDVWINFARLVHKTDGLKSKSKLNTTKYRRS